MFEKLLSVLPYNPSLIQQMSFYGRRMRQEASIRRIGLIFMVLTFMVQFFAVLSPPRPSSADTCDGNNLIHCGLDSSDPITDAHNKCKNDVQGYQHILHYYGISCNAFNTADVVHGDGIHSTDANNYYSMGRNTSPGVDTPVTINRADSLGGPFTVYWRLLSTFNNGNPDMSWPAIHLKDYQGKDFYLIISCGNLVTVGRPPANPLPKPSQGSDDLIVDDVVGSPQPTPAPAPAPPPTAPHAPPVLGINGATCAGGITGWASADEANSSDVIRVDIYADGQAGSGGVQIGSTNNGGHGYPGTNPSFTFPIPAAYVTGGHTFYIYAINGTNQVSGPGVVGPNGPLFGPNPVTITGPSCTPPPPPPAELCTINPALPPDTLKSSPLCVPPTPTKPTPCPQDSSLTLDDNACKVCPEDSSILVSDSKCKPCEASLNQQDTTACVTIHKSATNDTANLVNANGTTAKAGDVITYTLYAQNNGKAKVKQYVFQENLSDVMDYADPTDLHGGTINSDKLVTWPAQDIPVGQTATVQLTVKIKDPIPTTPASPTDPTHFDLTMTNVYGNTVNIKVQLPATPAVAIQTAAANAATTLPNTGPGTSLFIGAVVVMIIAYFYSRARLLARESTLAVQETATSA